MPNIFQKQANAYDKMLDAAADLAVLIESGGFVIDEMALEELTIFLAQNTPAVRQILKGLKGSDDSKRP